MRAHSPKQRILADRKQEPPRETLSRSPTQGETKMVDNVLQSRSTTREGLCDLAVELLREYLPPATRTAASESSDLQADPNATTVCRQVGQTSPVSTVNLRRPAAAHRTAGCLRS